MILRHRSKKAGHQFNLTVEDLDFPEYCPVLGIKLENTPFISDCTPSVDRVDNNKGYVRDNIVLVSFRANRIKSNATPEELRKVADFYSKLEGK